MCLLELAGEAGKTGAFSGVEPSTFFPRESRSSGESESKRKAQDLPKAKKRRRKLQSERELEQYFPNFKKMNSVGRGSWGVSDRYHQSGKGNLSLLSIPRGMMVSERVQSSTLAHHSLAHPLITNILEVLLLPSFLVIVKEYIDSYSLLSYVTKKGRLSEWEARRYFQQIVVALDYLHRKGIAHKDLKLEHCIMSCAPERGPMIKLTGFEMAKHERIITRETMRTSSSRAFVYRSPELWGNIHWGPDDGKAADMWNLGVILYALVYGRFPFPFPRHSVSSDADATSLLQLRFPEEEPGVSGQCKHIIEGLLTIDSKERMTVKNVLEDPWFLEDVPAKALTLNDQMCSQKNLPPAYTQRQSHEEVEQLLQEATTSNGAEPFSADSLSSDPETFLDHQIQELFPEEMKDRFQYMKSFVQARQDADQESATLKK